MTGRIPQRPAGEPSVNVMSVDLNTPTVHVLKATPAYFRHLASGYKTFEIRKNDRAFQPGDFLLIREYDSTVHRHLGPELRFQIGLIAAGTLFGLELGEYVVLSLLPVGEQ